METLVEEPADREAFIKLANYPLIKHTDMESEMRNEAVEICTGAIEKFSGNQEKSAQLIKSPRLVHAAERNQLVPPAHEIPRLRCAELPCAKDSMDKKFGAPWNVVLGHYYSFEITSEVKHLLYLFVQGQTAVLVWKSQ